MSLAAMEALGLDEVWWLVSPGNPLKDKAKDMAPYAVRFASAQAMARRSRIRVSDFEAQSGTRYTVDTIRLLLQRYPRHRFIWLMGEDTVAQFHQWRHWRALARMVPIAVISRPCYEDDARADQLLVVNHDDTDRWLQQHAPVSSLERGAAAPDTKAVRSVLSRRRSDPLSSRGPTIQRRASRADGSTAEQRSLPLAQTASLRRMLTRRPNAHSCRPSVTYDVGPTLSRCST